MSSVSLWERFLGWLNKPSSESTLLEAEVILAQSFGQAEEGPGLTNQQLAQVVRDLHQRTGARLVLQREVAEALPDLPMDLVVRRHRTPGQYLDTREVLLQSRGYCAACGWTKAIVVAHPDHLWRVARTARRLGLQVILPDTRQVTYDPKSTQEWTRSRWRFLPRELGAILLYCVRGWL
jgi:hypothetical protein